MGYSNWSSSRSFSTKTEYGFSGTEIFRKNGGVTSYFGYSVAINAAGDTVVVGGYLYSYNRGFVLVYKNINGVWSQLGNTLYGSEESSYFGYSVDINAAGDIIVIGTYNDNRALVYKLTANNWGIVGSALAGDSTYDQLGTSVAINAAGDTIVTGAPAAILS